MTTNLLIQRWHSSSWVWSLMLPAAVLLTAQLSPLATANPWTHVVEPCEPKTVIIDNSVQSRTVDNYTISFKACRSDNPVSSECHLKEGSSCEQKDCNFISGVGNITQAQFAEDTCKGTIQLLPDDNTKFNVILKKGSFTKTGVYKCTISYQYTSECYSVFFQFDCPCSGQVNLDLTVEVVDLELSIAGNRDAIQMVENDGKETKFQVKDDSSVTLNCSIDFPDQLSVTGTKLNFAFWSSTDPLSSTDNYNKTLSCDEATPSQDGNWVITRSGNTCYLTINFSSADNGQYVCYTYIPNDNAPYNSDRSNTISLLSATKLQPSTVNPQTLGLIVTVVIAVLIAFIVVSVLVFLFISAHFGYKFIRQHQTQEPVQTPIVPEGNNTTYGSTRSTNTDLSRPPTPLQVTLMQNQREQEDKDKVKESDSSEIESSFSNRTPQSARRPSPTSATVIQVQPEEKKIEVAGTPARQSSDEELDPGVASDDLITKENIYASNKISPRSLQGKYVCESPDKNHACDQKESHTHHTKEKTHTTDGGSSSGEESNGSTSNTGSHTSADSSSGSQISAATAAVTEGKEYYNGYYSDSTDQHLEGSPSYVSQLNPTGLTSGSNSENSSPGPIRSDVQEAEQTVVQAE